MCDVQVPVESDRLMVSASRAAGQILPSRYQPSRKITLSSTNFGVPTTASSLALQPSSSSKPSQLAARRSALMLWADARTDSNAPATRGLARLELQSHTKRLGRAHVVGANAPGLCGSTRPHTCTVSSRQDLEECCSPGRGKIGTSRGQGRCAVAGAPSMRSLGTAAIAVLQWPAFARSGDCRARCGSILTRAPLALAR